MTSNDTSKTGNTWAGEEDAGETTGGNNQTNQERLTQTGNMIAPCFHAHDESKSKTNPYKQEASQELTHGYR